MDKVFILVHIPIIKGFAQVLAIHFKHLIRNNYISI